MEGEAFFSVCEIRFTLYSSYRGGDVRVLGTEFNLSAYPGNVR